MHLITLQDFFFRFRFWFFFLALFVSFIVFLLLRLQLNSVENTHFICEGSHLFTRISKSNFDQDRIFMSSSPPHLPILPLPRSLLSHSHSIQTIKFVGNDLSNHQCKNRSSNDATTKHSRCKILELNISSSGLQ